MRTSVMDTDDAPVLAPAASVAGPATPVVRLDRRAVRGARRRARRLRHLYAFGGLAVLACFLAAAVVVVDMVR